ncbi:uncharacterized protein LOC122505730 [Leptopilina heterotoma]|uniref:uncharacterized protein LOC122505730 n=1 Tax=Leptopilina heterotoma TaxID=63436 RepID=UPI001CA9B56B|nr:uncharacterized protein LOC122505730 [Leptopilina heterotoma]
MIGSAIICFFSLVNGFETVTKEMDLVKLQNSLLESEKYVKNHVGYEDSAIFISNSGAVSSALINYIIGNKLKVVKVPPFNKMTITKADNQSGPEINNDESFLKIANPKKWTSKEFPNLTLWDVPDFYNDIVEMKDIIRAFSVCQLVKNVKSLKIILVFDIKDIVEDNTFEFQSFLKAVEELFANKFKQYFSSISVIFTNVPNMVNEIPVSYEYINYYLNNLLQNEIQWSEISKDFLQYLVNNNDRIALFKEPSREGILINNDIDVNIFRVIKNSESIQKSSLQDVHPPISAHSILGLHEAQKELFPKSTFDDIKNILQKKFQKISTNVEKITTSAERNETIGFLEYLMRIRGILHSSDYEGDIYSKTNIVASIDNDIRNIFERHGLFGKIELIMFMEKLLDTEISKTLEDNIDDIIVSSETEVNRTITFLIKKLSESPIEKKNTNSWEMVTNFLLDLYTSFTHIYKQ